MHTGRSDINACRQGYSKIILARVGVKMSGSRSTRNAYAGRSFQNYIPTEYSKCIVQGVFEMHAGRSIRNACGQEYSKCISRQEHSICMPARITQCICCDNIQNACQHVHCYTRAGSTHNACGQEYNNAYAAGIFKNACQQYSRCICQQEYSKCHGSFHNPQVILGPSSKP